MPIILIYMLKKALWLFLILFPASLFMQETLPVVPLPFLQREDPKALFDYTIHDSRIEFFAEGSWEVQAAGKIAFTFNPASSPALTVPIPVFTQKVDLSLWFLLNNSWYFEAAFAEGFKKNTVAAGYFGDGFIKHARISNRNIGMSQNHGLTDIGSSDNQAPGISVQMGKGPWAADVFVRYDAYEQRSKLFYGKNEINEVLIESNNWVRTIYKLPSEKTAGSIMDVFVEDEKGDYTHQSGKKLSKLLKGQYIVIPSDKLLILHKAYSGIILVSIAPETNTAQTTQRIIDELGSFTTGGFFKTVQDEFSDSNPQIDVSLYSYCSNDSSSYISSINSIQESILLIQNPPFFSPFVCSAYYETDAENIDVVSVILKNSEQKSQKFYADISSNSRVYSQVSSGKKKLIEVYRKDDYSKTFPFAAETPFIYLSHPSSGEIVYSISVKSLTPISSFDIGTNTIEGTIQVSINGISENDFTYDKQKGTVSFGKELHEEDRITIVWMEESENFDHGFVSFAGGLTYTFNPDLRLMGGLSVTYPVTAQKFMEFGYSEAGSIKAAAGVQYAINGFSIQNTIQVNAVNTNPAGLLRIDGMNTVSSTSYLAQNSIQKISDTEFPSLNSRDSTLQLLNLTVGNKMNSTLGAVTDQDISGYAFRSSWEVPNTIELEYTWTAIEIDLSTRAQDLKNAEIFSIAFKELAYTQNKEYDIYLQLGNAEDTLEKNLYEQRIGTWKISKGAGEANAADVVQSIVTSSSITSWQTAQVALSNKDRSLIQNKPFARIIFVQHLNDPPELVSASILTGPYEIVIPKFNASGPGAYTYTSYDASSMNHENIKIFNPKGKNSVQNLLWNSTGEPTTERVAGYQKRVGIIPLDNYKKFGFFLYADNPSDFSSITFNLNSTGESYTQPVYTVTIDNSLLEQRTWLKIEIDTSTLSVSINGKDIGIKASHLSSLNPDTMEIHITTMENGSGRILIDEVYASESDLNFEIENRLHTAYKKEGVILSVKEIPLVSNFSAELTSESAYSVSHNHASVPVTAITGVTLNALSLSGGVSANYRGGDYNGTSYNEGTITRAFHSISTVPIFFPLTVLSLSEDFSFSPLIQNAYKQNSVSVNVPNSIVPFLIKAQTKAVQENNFATQKVSIDTTVSFPKKLLTYSLTNQTSFEQKKEKDSSSISYAKIYSDSLQLQFSNAADSFQRKENTKLTQSLSLSVLNAKPSFTISGANEYSSIKEPLNTSLLSIQTDIPFSIKTHQLTMSHKNEFITKKKTTAGGSYSEDLALYAQNLGEAAWFFKQILFYDLYSPELFTLMNNENTNNNLYYTSSYNSAWKRPLFLTSLDFFIPSTVETGISRSVISTGSSQGTDAISINGGLGFTAFNCFGTFSSKPFFTWYEQDELIHTWKAEYTLEKASGKILDYSISGFEQLTIFITDTNTIQQSIDITLKNKNLSLTTGLIWSRPGKTSPISSLIMLAASDKEEMNLIRNTGIEYSLDKGTVTQSFKGYHELKTTIHTFFSIRSRFSASFVFTNSALKKLDIEGILAAKIQF